MTNFKCTECKLAEWDRTKDGRLSPSGDGRCTWEKTFRVAASTRLISKDARFFGGYICRKRDYEHPTKRCGVFQPIKKGTQ